MHQIDTHFNLQEELGNLDDYEALKQRFSFLISKVATMGRVVCILDGVNNIESNDLSWLPQSFPSNFKLIITTNPTNSRINTLIRNDRRNVLEVWSYRLSMESDFFYS
jgi:hypothetical protein